MHLSVRLSLGCMLGIVILTMKAQWFAPKYNSVKRPSNSIQNVVRERGLRSRGGGSVQNGNGVNIVNREGSPDSEITWHNMNWQPRRCHVVCCGWGDRFATVEAQLEGLFSVNKSLALDWGPCTDAVPNIITELFDFPQITRQSVPHNLPQDQTIYGYDRGDAPHDPWEKFYSSSDDKCDPTPEEDFPELNISGEPSYYGKNHSALKGRKRSKPDWYSILSEPMAKFYTAVFDSIRPKYRRYVDELMEANNWSKSNTIAIHIRTGNTVDVNGETKKWDKSMITAHRSLTFNEKRLMQYLDLCEAVAKRLEWDDFHIFVASDTDATVETMRKISKRNIISRKELLPITPGMGHPMVWANLHEDNAKERCKMEWFVDPLLDMKLLSAADVLISTSATGFVTAPQSYVYEHDGVLCFTDDHNQLSCKRRKSDPESIRHRKPYEAHPPINSPDRWPPNQIKYEHVIQYTIQDWFTVNV